MSNTTAFFDLINRYRTLVKVENDKADNRLKEIEEMKGSPYYDRKAAEIEDERMREIRGYRESIGRQLDEVLNSMRENAARVLPVDVPTQDMIHTIELLKLKENPTWDEIREAGAICMNNKQAFAVVEEIANKHHVPLPAKPKTYGTTETNAAIDNLLSFARVTLQLDRVNNRQQWFQMAHENMTGVKDTTGGRGMDFYMVDGDCADTKEMIMNCGQIETESQYKDFCAAVND